MTKKSVCEITFTQVNGDQFLSIKTDKKIENLFKTKEIETSANYKDQAGQGLKFYKLNPKIEEYTRKYSATMPSYSRFILSRYGTELFLDGSYVNVSILRTVGIDSGITVAVNGLVVEAEVQNWIKFFAGFVKYIYLSFIEKTEIKATINLEF